MNPGQNSKYWKRWAAVYRHNHWRWLKGRLVPEAVKDASAHHQAIWQLAETLADQACRAPVADDLRHACHIHALGRDISHERLDNSQFDRLLLLWGNDRECPGLLIEPLHVESLMCWDDLERARKQSLIRSIEDAAEEPYIASITADIWGTKHWRDLDARALLGLLRKIKGNAPARTSQPF